MTVYHIIEEQVPDIAEGKVQRLLTAKGPVWVRWTVIGKRKNLVPVQIARPSTTIHETGRHRAPVPLWRRIWEALTRPEDCP